MVMVLDLVWMASEPAPARGRRNISAIKVWKIALLVRRDSSI